MTSSRSAFTFALMRALYSIHGGGWPCYLQTFLVADLGLRLSIADTARRICMCYECASLSNPLGAQSVSDQKRKNWITEKLNLLMGGLYVTYTAEYLDILSMMILEGIK